LPRGRKSESRLHLCGKRFEADLKHELLGRNHLCHDRVMTFDSEFEVN